MSLALLLPLAAWQNFYVIIGTAAARLSGLMFVVIALVTGVLRRVLSPMSGIRVFNTPSAGAFWCRVLRRRAAQCPVAGALAGEPPARPGGSGRGVFRRPRALGGVRHLLSDY